MGWNGIIHDVCVLLSSHSDICSKCCATQTKKAKHIQTFVNQEEEGESSGTTCNLAWIVAFWTEILEAIYSIRSTLNSGSSPSDLELVVLLLQTTQAQCQASVTNWACGRKVANKMEHKYSIQYIRTSMHKGGGGCWTQQQLVRSICNWMS